ncbi:MAG: tetratricopeptide repeat protein [Synechococcales bacterium]|nr:tetratricopeptide repeat protein [Cyanobacteria bacterium REEB444]MEB3125757.1 tetratricopeptide repeat protein [Synechococcales bacterium]
MTNSYQLSCLSGIALLGLLTTTPAIAQPTTADTLGLPFPQIRELDLPSSDPLLPPDTGRPLNSSERQTLGMALDRLNEEGMVLLAAKNAEAAFIIWAREVRLRQALGPIEEVKALGRVGALAWRENQRTVLNQVILRLSKLQQHIESKLPRQSVEQLPVEFLQDLAQAYEAVRLIDPALQIQQQLLAHGRRVNEPELVATSLETMARLNWNWFRYPAAAQFYEEWLALLRSRGSIDNDRTKEIAILKLLAVAYGEIGKWQQAILVQNQLIELYQRQSKRNLIPQVQIAMAGHYQRLNELNTAGQLYQSAYRLAISLQQFTDAADALKPLGNLYRSNQQWNDALIIYEVLLELEQQIYDTYGQMETYDQIGQIYEAKKAYGQARLAFDRGLRIAQQLNVKQDYFQEKLEWMPQ